MKDRLTKNEREAMKEFQLEYRETDKEFRKKSEPERLDRIGEYAFGLQSRLQKKYNNVILN